MTGRPAFGDFLTAARDHASVAAARPETDRGGDHVQEVTDSLLHVITVMSRYLNDITTVPGDEQPGIRPPMTAWGSARINARDALANAAGHLRQHSRRRRAPGVTPRSELARRLDATAVTLTAGRDLLHTHLTRDPRGARQFRSEWALVICSPPAEQALLAELASLTRQITPPVHRPGPDLHLPGHRRRATQPTPRLRLAPGRRRLRAERAANRPGPGRRP
jgi:hypothetical protein